MPATLRDHMEAQFGADFSGVRIHVGHHAPQIGALAFTIGEAIHFAPGQYQPDSPQGRRLIGHELAHVVQQRSGRVRGPAGGGLVAVHDPLLETEAERRGMAAAMAWRSGSAAPARSPGPVVQPAGGRVAQCMNPSPSGSRRGSVDYDSITLEDLKSVDMSDNPGLHNVPNVNFKPSPAFLNFRYVMKNNIDMSEREDTEYRPRFIPLEKPESIENEEITEAKGELDSLYFHSVFKHDGPGYEFEKKFGAGILGNNPGNIPTIDDFRNDVGTSLKTIDLLNYNQGTDSIKKIKKR